MDSTCEAVPGVGREPASDFDKAVGILTSKPSHKIEYRLRNLRLTSVDIRDSGRREKDARDDYGVVGYTLRATLTPKSVFSASPVIYKGSVLIPGRDHPPEFELSSNEAVLEPAEGGLTEVLYVPASERRDFFFVPSRTKRYLQDIGISLFPEESDIIVGGRSISDLLNQNSERDVDIVSVYPIEKSSFALDSLEINRQTGQVKVRRTIEPPSEEPSLEAYGTLSPEKYKTFLNQLATAEEIARQLYVPAYKERKGDKNYFGKLLVELHLASTYHGRPKPEIPTSFPIKTGFKIRESVEKRLGKRLRDI